jgi:hypothetical protein
MGICSQIGDTCRFYWNRRGFENPLTGSLQTQLFSVMSRTEVRHLKRYRSPPTVTPIKRNSCSQISLRNINSHYMEMATFCTWTLIPMPSGYPPHLHLQPDCCSMQRANIIRFLPLPSASKKKSLLRRRRIPKDLQFHYRVIHNKVTLTQASSRWTEQSLVNRRRKDYPERPEVITLWWWRQRHMFTEASDASQLRIAPETDSTTRSYPGSGLYCCSAVELRAGLKECRFKKMLPTLPLCARTRNNAILPPPHPSKMRPAFKIKWGDDA